MDDVKKEEWFPPCLLGDFNFLDATQGGPGSVSDGPVSES
jgi:hypothetical protein